jgi:bifunctional non-homologous end joining protein LigD
MPLQEYRRKRRFDKTAEPRGGDFKRGRTGPTTATRLSFVVQKHAASHLHYDFRLELNGVLLSWALPKGPCLDPHEKRLAVHVEDHPLEYGDFEGAIPPGQYGGGTVMVWDRGIWEPHGDPVAAYRQGKLTFTLQGKKLHGDWTLVRMRGRTTSGGKENWLLIKSQDDAAQPLAKYDVLEQLPESAKTGRSLDEIAAGTETWTNGKSSGRRTKRATKPAPQTTRVKPTAVRRARFPAHPEAQLATLVDHPPSGDDWLHEIKFDGYRMFCLINRGKISFISRNGQDWTERLGSLIKPIASLDVEQAVLDGEVVVLDDEGVSRFQLLQNALGRDGGRVPLHYFVFDLLYCNGHDLMHLPLEERKQALEQLLRGKPDKVHYSEHILGAGDELYGRACRSHWEGIISKRRSAPYQSGRGTDWLKSKCKHEQEFVVAGYSDPGGSRSGFGSLLLGYYVRGKLTYAGRVGTGFTRRTLDDVYRQLQALKQKTNPFDRGGDLASGRDVHWVKPRLVAQIEFANWTDDNLLRQPSFQGLRDDKPARAIRREMPAAMPKKRSRRTSKGGRRS